MVLRGHDSSVSAVAPALLAATGSPTTINAALARVIATLNRLSVFLGKLTAPSVMPSEALARKSSRLALALELVDGVYQTFQPVQQEVGIGMRVDHVSPRSLLLEQPGPQTSFSILGPLARKNDALVTSILTPRAFS